MQGWGAKKKNLACLTESAHKVVVKKSIPTQIRQLILYISNDKDSVDGFVRESIFAKRRYKHFM